MESTVADPRIGLVLNGRYRITAPLGEGGMGMVYLGERLQLRRPVAIKFLHTPYADSAKFVARFEREARAMSMLSHPYCVSVLDYGVQQAPYIIMDFVTGSTLRQVLDQERLSPQRALRITRQVLIGLAHAHEQGVVHRDIKPGNIMLGEATGLSDHVRIFDFGLAKLHDPELHGEASIAAIVGTPAYMAPEQARAEKVDERADLYAAGVVLFEMLTGQKPFEADNAYQLLCLQRDKPAPRLRELSSELSVELEAVVSKALEKAPADRYQTAAEFGLALEATPEWAGAGYALELAPGAAPALALAKTQHVESSIAPVFARAPEGTLRPDERPGPAAQATPASVPRTRRRWPLVALLVVTLFGFAWWQLHLQPQMIAGRSALPAWKRVADARTTPPAEPQRAAPPAAGLEAAQTALKAAADALVPSEVTPSVPAPEETADRDDRGAGEEPSELSEAALAAADEALNDSAEREVVLDVASERQKRPVENVADVRALISKGESDAAIRGIRQLRAKRPRDAQLPFLLGNLYFEKGWWLDGLAKYRETVALSSSYRKNAALQRNAIRALAQDKAYPRARALLVRDIGRPALPALRRAAHSGGATARRRANSIAKQIAR